MMQRVQADGRSRFLIVVATAVFGLATSGAHALADGGGVSTSAPEVTDVRCASECAGPRSATVGSVVRIEGKRLGATETVSFAAETGGRTEAGARGVSGRSASAVVPAGAATGRVIAIETDGTATRSPRELEIVDSEQVDPDPDSDDFQVTSVEAAPRRAFYGSGRGTRVRYSFDAAGPTNVRITVTKRSSGREVDSWVVRGAEPFTENSARWNGKSAEGKVLDKGRFAFSVAAAGQGSRAAKGASARFDVYPDKFPVRGKHGFGDGFGAGRGHQGADIFADCGTRMVAARGGRVQYRGYQSSAGNYVVIDTKGSGVDHVYMHLTDQAKVREGEKVETGQAIGKVGETGNAQGCHLHFEIWSAPGWYEGGNAEPSVMRQVKKWDGWS